MVLFRFLLLCLHACVCVCVYTYVFYVSKTGQVDLEKQLHRIGFSNARNKQHLLFVFFFLPE